MAVQPPRDKAVIENGGIRTERNGRSAARLLSVIYRAIPVAVYSFMHNFRLD